MSKSLKEKIVEVFTPKTEKKEVKEVPKVHPEYDPSLPENKQRHLR